MPFLTKENLKRRSKEGFSKIPFEFDRWETFGNAYDRHKKDVLTNRAKSIFNKVMLGNNSDTKKISAEEANKRFPYMEEKFSESVQVDVANFLAKRQREKRLMEARIASGPDDYLQTVMNFGAGMGAELTDPINIGLSMSFGVFGAAAASGSAGLAKIFGGSSLRAALSREFAASVAMEPLNILSAKALKDQTSIADSAANIAVGTMVGGALDFGAGKAFDFFKDFKNKTGEKKLNATQKLLDYDKTVRLDMDDPDNLPILPDDFNTGKSIVRNKNRSPGPPRPGDEVFVGTTIPDKAFDRTFDTSFNADGVFEVDSNPENLAKAMKNAGSKGKIFKAKINDEMNFIDADAEFKDQPDFVKNFMKNELGQDSGSLSSGLENIKFSQAAEKHTKLKDLMDQNNVDGYFSKKKSGSRFESTKYHMNESAKDKMDIDESSSVDPRNSSLKKNQKKRAQDYVNDPTTDMFYDPEIDEKVSSTSNKPTFDEDIRPQDEVGTTPDLGENLDFDEEATPSEVAQKIFGRELETEEAKDIMVKSKEAFEELESDSQTAKALTFCMRK